MTNQFNTMWWRIFGCNKGRQNPTIIRKYSTNKVHRNRPDLKQATAVLQCHSLSTAEKKYAMTARTQTASNTVAELRKVLRTDYETKETGYEHLFGQEIRNGLCKISDVRDRLPHLSQKQQKKVQDRVRYLTKK